MGELELILKLELRDPTLFDRVWWRCVMRVDKPEVDLFREFKTKYSVIQETVRYINLSSAYIFRIHLLLDAFDAGEESKNQYIVFCNTLLFGLDKNKSYLPYSFVAGLQSFRALSGNVQSRLSISSDVIIDATYEELKNGHL